MDVQSMPFSKLWSTRRFRTIRAKMSVEGSPMRNLPLLLRRIMVPYAVLVLSSVICSARASPLQIDFRQSFRASQNLTYLPLGFEQSLGQVSPTFGFLARANGYFLY